ncbi:natural killer cell receptor 2B4 [Pteropus vampyrus]|uniref:Natural killer cell receptor 2B4 n=1 Tax=Pteropus vampyrus TaxID=132908 RepID=A0A6P6BQB0_PTEVA|nr:natural killer cell receptor 2B4 [Pteropus vampyrus]
MLGQALALTLLLLLEGHQGQASPDSADRVTGLSGAPVRLQPPSTLTRADSVEWKVQLHTKPEFYVILTWKNTSGDLSNVLWVSESFNNRLSFKIEDLSLLINATQQQDSGLYLLEVTREDGSICRHEFQISVFDHVEKPRLLEQWKALDRGRCQVTLSCLVSRGGNVSYAWYRGSELIQTTRNLSELEEQVGVGSRHKYTCNVSNPVSWATQTLELTQACHPPPLCYLSPRTVPAVCCVTTCPVLFVAQEQEHSSLGEERTIYSSVQAQSAAPTSRETESTLYSVVQPARAAGRRLQGALREQASAQLGRALLSPSPPTSGSRKRSHSPAVSITIYEEIGKQRPEAQNAVRLSRKELEGFRVYPYPPQLSPL